MKIAASSKKDAIQTATQPARQKMTRLHIQDSMMKRLYWE
ncbi:MAG: hypothetical protein [Olavius algarvensis spirochete endosymbiont]|nr:MAG: hypothetical protein [Olavius algarvensis spirochete endosymbiont]